MLCYVHLYVYSLVGICVIAPVIMCSICCMHFCNVFKCVRFHLHLCFVLAVCIFLVLVCIFCLQHAVTRADYQKSRQLATSQSAPLTAIQNPLECFFLEPSWRSRLSRSLLAPTCCAFELSTVENIFAASPAKCDRKSSIELEVGCWLADI